MQLRTLGAHNAESRHTRMESHLIDGALALDAGSLTRALTPQEQRGIRAIILSHRHYDHIKDIPTLGIAIRGHGDPVDIYGIPDTLDALKETLLSGRLFPDFTTSPSAAAPTFRLHPVEFYRPFDVLGYTATALPVPHAVPAAGFLLRSDDVTLFYTGDTGRGLSAAWEYANPDVLLTEVTFGNANEAAARTTGHLTPALLMKVLDDFRKLHGRLPKVLVSHINPPWEDAVRAELAEIMSATGQGFIITEADGRYDLSGLATDGG